MRKAKPIASAATREAALARLMDFVPRAREYARVRNHDRGPGQHDDVSRLSPYLRHRLVDEQEVIAAVRDEWGDSAGKYVQEVIWRAYWKGWLQMRPRVWRDYQADRDAEFARLDNDSGLRVVYDAACVGKTGIACLDAWAMELRATGYLHNHARMWFASIWIHTLGLPWSLGADFFYRHLLDGDPASNTLSWRWVGGLHTPGKTYLARRDNVRICTDGRFDPAGLADTARSVTAPPAPDADPGNLPSAPLVDRRGRAHDAPEQLSLLVTPEDLLPERWASGLPGWEDARMFVMSHEPARSPRATSPVVTDFVERACASTLQRLSATRWSGTVEDAASLDALCRHPVVVTAFAPVGPTADLVMELDEALERRGVRVLYATRDYDRTVWPHATRGFFALGKRIPTILSALFED